MNLRIYYYTDNISAGNPVTETMKLAAHDAHPYMDEGDWVDWGQREYRPGHPEMAQTGVTKGGIIIWDWDRKVALKLIQPYQVGRKEVADALKTLWGYEYDPDNGKYVTQDGTRSVLPPNDGFLPGFPIWGFNINLPEWFYWLVGGISAVQAVSSESAMGKVGWGTVSVVTLKSLYNKKAAQK